jgi:hypothetical protein
MKKALRALSMAFLFIAIGVTQSAHAEATTIHCIFGTYQVEITPDHKLEVSSDGRAMYSGPAVINTDYRTIRIQGATLDSPRITTQSLSTSGQPNHARLFIKANGAGQDIEGSCIVETMTTSDTLVHDS